MAKSAAPKIDSEAEYRALCTVTGHLFLSFATLEATLSACLRIHLGRQFKRTNKSPGSLPAAIFGSMRFSQSRDAIKRIMDAEYTPRPTADFVLGVFEQIGHIENLRNHLAHQLTNLAEEGPPHWQATDMVTTRKLAETKIYVFTAEAVHRAGNDLVTAAKRLGNVKIKASLFDDPSFDVSPIPWQYKPSMLKLAPQNTQRNPLGLRHQRKSSRP